MKKGWEVKKLGELCDISTGKWDANHALENGEFRFFTCAREPMLCNTKRFSGECLVLPGNGVNVGDVYYYKGDFDAYQRTYVISKIKPYPKYLFYHMLAFWKERNLNKQYGSATNFLKIGNFNEYEISLPPLPEQKRIVAILDEAFAAISTAKANAEKNLQNARELFESYLQGVFANQGNGWVEKQLENICENLDSKRVPVTKRDRKKGKYPYYGASGIVDYVNEFIFDEDVLLVSEDGANLLARTYPIAFSISGKTWVNNHAHVLRFEDIASQRFVELYLNSVKLDDYVSGMAQPKLNQKMLNSIVIPFPELKIQKQIVAKLDAFSAETKKLEVFYQQKIADLDELKKSILQKAFNGELAEAQV